MKILLFGAGGMVGQRILAEALSRGHEVTAATRSGVLSNMDHPRLTVVVGDASDDETVGRLAAGHDAVASAVGPPRDGTDASGPLVAVARGLIAGLRKAGVRRLVIVGGAGSLEVAPGLQLVDSAEMEAAYKPESLAQRDALAVFREADDLDWTYISPAALLKPGERTGRFRLGGDQLLTDAEGNSQISAEDYAVAFVDELENGTAIRRRISVAY